MDFDEYQKQTRATAIYPDADHNIFYPALGLAGETGEVVDKVKKVWRDDGGELSNEAREAIAQELGDVLWYTANLATELGVSLGEVAEANIEKIHGRKDRGKLSGSGDNR